MFPNTDNSQSPNIFPKSEDISKFRIYIYIPVNIYISTVRIYIYPKSEYISREIVPIVSQSQTIFTNTYNVPNCRQCSKLERIPKVRRYIKDRRYISKIRRYISKVRIYIKSRRYIHIQR